MAIREDPGIRLAASPSFQSMPAPGGSMSMRVAPSPNFQSMPAPQGIVAPQSFGPQGLVPRRFGPQQYATAPNRYSGPGVDAFRSQPQEPQYSRFQPREPLPGPWINPNDSKVRKAAPKASPRKQTSFWSTEDNIMKREEAAQHLCHVKEELLEQRITFVENILFRSMDLPAHDVKYAAELVEEAKEEDEKKKAEEQDKHDHDFQRHYIGPYPNMKWIDKFPENGFFVDSLRAVKDWPYLQDKAEEHERWRKSHPMLCALAGDFSYMNRELKQNDLL